jgi:murein DD-endopeptidase MepM/ murein hydrolase activator NlpD
LRGADTYGMRGVFRLVARGTLPWLFCIALLTGCHGGQLPERVVHHRVYHQVQRGQTLWSIARVYGVNVQLLARANRLSDADVLHVGQRLYIPGATEQRQVTSRCPCGSNVSKSARTSAPTAASPRPANTSPVARGTSPMQPPRFIWPVQGPITRHFKPGGKHQHDGIDIAAPKGTPIRAAADGMVIYSDWGPGGYGRIVILRHGANMVTVYAHNQRNLVQVGQVVRQGDPIAAVGKSGRASGYHLHFEIRRKTVPVSPVKYLARSRQVAQLERR